MDKLWLGDITDGTNLEGLKKNEIKAIVCLLEPAGENYFLGNIPQYSKTLRDLGIKRSSIPLYDGVADQEVLIRQALARGNSFLDEGLTTLVHCGAGISRSASVTIGLLMQRVKLSWDEAEAFVREKRPIINPAVPLKISVLKVLGIWPYDGSIGESSNTVLVGE